MPATTAFPASADWYAWLTQAEQDWKPLLAAEYPYHMFTAPTLMTTGDGGVTFQFPGESAPLAVEVYTAINGDRMIAGQFGDTYSDYVWEGSQIRMPANQVVGFSNGAPYARWVPSPGTIDANTQSTMKPAYTRILLVHRALIYRAKRPGSGADPSMFQTAEDKAWKQLQEALKNSNVFYGDAANRQTRRVSGIGYLLARGSR